MHLEKLSFLNFKRIVSHRLEVTLEGFHKFDQVRKKFLNSRHQEKLKQTCTNFKKPEVDMLFVLQMELKTGHLGLVLCVMHHYVFIKREISSISTISNPPVACKCNIYNIFHYLTLVRQWMFIVDIFSESKNCCVLLYLSP